MKYLVDSREMQKYDANTISHFKVPGLLLMERAAIAFVEELHRQNVDLTEVLIVCGSGNNGGDGADPNGDAQHRRGTAFRRLLWKPQNG